MRSRGLGFWRIPFCDNGPCRWQVVPLGPSQVQTCNVVSLADDRGGARLSLEESRRKEHQGGRVSSSLDPPFLVGGTLRGSAFFFCLACGPVSYARNGPPPGWAGWEGWSRRREGSFPPPKPSPWGEGAPVRTLGRMRGRSTGPTGQEKEGVGATGPSFYKERLGTGSPPHQSPSVTASPQGEASGMCSPTRKKRSKSGHADGHRNSPTTVPLRHPTPKRASGNERAIKKGGRGVSPRDSLRPGFL